MLETLANVLFRQGFTDLTKKECTVVSLN